MKTLADLVCASTASEATVFLKGDELILIGRNLDVQIAANVYRSGRGEQVLPVASCSGAKERESGSFPEFYAIRRTERLDEITSFLCREILAKSSSVESMWRPFSPPAELMLAVSAGPAEHKDVCVYLKGLGEGSDCSLRDSDGNFLRPDGGLFQ